MNVRGLLQLLGINSVNEVNLLAIANMIEAKVRDLFDAETVAKFNGSKNNNGRYDIWPEDSEVINSAKSMINLLRTLHEVMPVVATAEAVVVSEGWFSAAKKLTYLTVTGTTIKAWYAGAKAAVWGGGAANIGDEVKRFNYHILQLKNAFSKMPAIQKNMQAVMDGMWESMPAALYQQVTSTRRKQIKDKTTAKVGYVDVGQLTGYVTDLCQHLKGDDDLTNKFRHLKGKILTTLSEIEKFQDENAGKELTWDLVSEEMKTYYSSLLKDLKFLSRNFPNKNNYKGYIKPISNWRHYNHTALGIKEMPGKLSVYDALDLIMAGINKQIPERIRKRYLDKETNLYSGYAEDQSLSEVMKYEMMAVNHAIKAKEIYRRIYFLNQLPLVDKASSLVEILNQAGDIMNEVAALHPDGAMNKNLERVLKEIFVAVVPVYKEMIKAACQSEVAMGFKDGAITGVLKPVADNVEKFAKLYQMDLKLDYPYEKQKIKAIDHAINKLKRERDDLDIGIAALSGVNLQRMNLTDLFLAEKVASRIKCYDSELLGKSIDKLLQELTGLDKLNKAIRKLEKLVASHVDARGGAEGVAEELQQLRQLYRHKALVEEVLKNARENPDELASINLYWDAGIKTEGIAARHHKFLGRAYTATISANLQSIMNSAIDMREATRVRLVKLSQDKAKHADKGYVVKPKAKSDMSDEMRAPSAPAVIPKEDSELVAVIVKRHYGPLITTLNQARKKMLDLSQQYLAEEQFAQLQHTHHANYLCEQSSNDGLLTACIKQSYNTLTLAEAIARKIKIVQGRKDTGSMFDTLQAFGILNDCRALIKQLQLTKQTLQALNSALDNQAMTVAHKKLKSLFELIKQIPQYIDIATNTLPSDVLSVVAPGMVAELNAVAAAAKAAVIEEEKEKEEEAQESTGLMASLYQKFLDEFERHKAPLVAEIPAGTTMVDGLYVTDKMQAGKETAILMNVGKHLQDALRAATDISRGDKISGVIDALMAHKKISDELLKLCATVDDEHDERVEGLLRYLTGKYLELAKVIKDKYKTCYAYAALSEKMLGLNEGVLTHKFKGIVDSLIEGANEYQYYQLKNVYYNIDIGSVIEAANFDEIRTNTPFYTTQLALAEIELKRLMKTPSSQLERMVAITHSLRANANLRPEQWEPVRDLEKEFIEQRNEYRDDYKIFALQRVCHDYMKDLSNICLRYLEKLDEDKYSDFMKRHQKLLNDPNGLDDLIKYMLKLEFGTNKYEHVIQDLNRTKEKLIAVLEMHDALLTKEKPAVKLDQFRTQFQNHLPRLDDGSPHFLRFVKLVIDIFRYGIKTSFRLWRTHTISPGLEEALHAEAPKFKPDLSS